MAAEQLFEWEHRRGERPPVYLQREDERTEVVAPVFVAQGLFLDAQLCHSTEQRPALGGFPRVLSQWAQPLERAVEFVVATVFAPGVPPLEDALPVVKAQHRGPALSLDVPAVFPPVKVGRLHLEREPV